MAWGRGRSNRRPTRRVPNARLRRAAQARGQVGYRDRRNQAMQSGNGR